MNILSNETKYQIDGLEMTSRYMGKRLKTKRSNERIALYVLGAVIILSFMFSFSQWQALLLTYLPPQAHWMWVGGQHIITLK